MRDDSASKKGTDDLHYCESSVPFFALSAQKSRAIRGGGANGISASPARDKAPYRKCRRVPNTGMDWAYKSGAEKILHAAQGSGHRLQNLPIWRQKDRMNCATAEEFRRIVCLMRKNILRGITYGFLLKCTGNISQNKGLYHLSCLMYNDRILLWEV